MLRFFRTFRQRFLAENRFSRYLLYAVGEIVLVVVGILIALQINNWNEDRKDRQTEDRIVRNLYVEFSSNLAQLNSVLGELEKTRDANLALMDAMGKADAELFALNTDSLIFNAVEFGTFIPSQNAFDNLLQAGGLQLISNEALKASLYEWTQILGQVVESYSGIDQKTQNEIVPYLTQRYPLKDIDRYGVLNWKEQSVLPVDKTAIFQDLAYENLIDDFLYRLRRYTTRLESARKHMQEILKQIEAR